MTITVERQVQGVLYRMPAHLAKMYDELARVENLYSSVPPRETFPTMRGLQLECQAEMQRLTEAGQVARVEE